MEKIEIGIVTKPQGLKGEFRVKHNINALKLFSKLKQVEINNQILNVEKTTDRGGFFVIKTKEYNSINEIENLRNFKVYTFVTNDVANKINNNVGYKVIANEKEIGVVMEVKNYGATDVYTLTNGKTFACVPNLIINVDDENKIVNVNAKILDEVILWK